MENMSFVFRCFLHVSFIIFRMDSVWQAVYRDTPFLRQEMYEISCLFFVKNGEGNGAISIRSVAKA